MADHADIDPSLAREEGVQPTTAELQAEIDRLLAENEQLDGENVELRDEVSELEARVDADLEAEIDDLRAENERLEAENAQLDDRVDEQEARVDTDLEATVDELQAENERLEAENADTDLRRTASRKAWEREGRPSDEEPVYVASKNRNKFHRPNCKWAEYIGPRTLIEFGSHREAVEAGYKPCGTCRA